MDLFGHKKNQFLELFKDYITPDPIKGYALEKKNHPFYKIVREYIPNLLEKKLKEQKMRNLNYIKIRSSTGEGRVAKCIWIALLDERLTEIKNNKPSTQNGIYICILFDESCENFYLCIAAGTEELRITEIREKSKVGREFFEKQIASDPMLKDFKTDNIVLSDSERPRKYAASTIINKKYNIFNFNEKELLKDICYLNDVFYRYVFEEYLNVMLPKQQGPKKDQRKKWIIKVDKHKELRKEREIRNEEIGKKAEKFIFEREKDILRNIGKLDLADSVEWLAKYEDGHGYDIKSFFPDGSEKLIEVKGSSFSRNNSFDFYLSRTEKKVAEEKRSAYVLSLVENVESDQIRVFDEIIDPLSKLEELIPTNYKATYKRTDQN
ncbi:DUF3578 domain-containing protein [Bacillus gobiensis]|uniref:MrcB family domain-containing protein n=1 Tax=Bacillus gobiensis TaxID=1441095 RepID=UPI003D1A13AE